MSQRESCVCCKTKKKLPELIYPKVSVIVRSYNSEKYVKTAVDSVLNQDYSGEIEVVICYDEGSTDNTLKILESIVQSRTPNKSVKLIRHKHTSLFDALTTYGFSNVSGDYVTFLDYDNLFPQAYIRKVVQQATDRCIRLLFTKARLIDRNASDLGTYLMRVPKDFHNVRKLMLRNYMDTNTIFIRCDCLKPIAFRLRMLTNSFYHEIHPDWLLSMLALRSCDVEYLDDVEVRYRIHESNVAVSTYIGISRDLHLLNLEKDFRTLTVFKYLDGENLDVSERLYLHLALLEKLILIFVLKWLIGRRAFSAIHRIFAKHVRFLERAL